MSKYAKKNEARRRRRKDPAYRKAEYEKNRVREEKDPITYLLHSARRRAKAKGIEYSITKDDLVLSEVCPLLEIPLKKNRGKMQYNSYSLDRKDSSLGYIPGNVWIISYRANWLKNNATLEELKLLVKNLKDHWEH